MLSPSDFNWIKERVGKDGVFYADYVSIVQACEFLNAYADKANLEIKSYADNLVFSIFTKGTEIDLASIKFIIDPFPKFDAKIFFNDDIVYSYEVVNLICLIRDTFKTKMEQLQYDKR